MKSKHYLSLILIILFNSRVFAGCIHVTDPWMPPTRGPDALVYMRIINTCPRIIRLISVESQVAPYFEFHVHVKGIRRQMKLARIDSIDIPGRGNITLRPETGEHIRLVRINQQILLNDNIPVTLRFANRENINVLIPVRGSR